MYLGGIRFLRVFNFLQLLNKKQHRPRATRCLGSQVGETPKKEELEQIPENEYTVLEQIDGARQ